MLKWQNTMVLYGENRKKTFTVCADGLNQVKRRTLQEFRKLAPQKKNLYLEVKQPGIYAIVSNLDDVGEVMLERVVQ